MGERIKYRRRNARIDDRSIDLLIVTDRSVYIIEVKVKPKHRLEARPILAGTIAGDEAVRYAREWDVLVYEP